MQPISDNLAPMGRPAGQAQAQPVWSLTLPSWAAAPAAGGGMGSGAVARLREALARRRRPAEDESDR